jgi:hypothetical protein
MPIGSIFAVQPYFAKESLLLAVVRFDLSGHMLR